MRPDYLVRDRVKDSSLTNRLSYDLQLGWREARSISEATGKHSSRCGNPDSSSGIECFSRSAFRRRTSFRSRGSSARAPSSRWRRLWSSGGMERSNQALYVIDRPQTDLPSVQPPRALDPQQQSSRAGSDPQGRAPRQAAMHRGCAACAQIRICRSGVQRL